MPTAENSNGDAGCAGIPVLHRSGITGAILAGGRSARMGTDKALLELQGQRLIERVHQRLAGLFATTLLVTNNPEQYSFLACPAVADRYPGEGSLAGIHAALHHAPTDLVFVVACDMPFLDRDLVRHICGLEEGYDAVVPESPEGSEPLHALYRTSCLPVMERMLDNGEKRIRDLIGRVNSRILPWEELARFPGARRSFLNLNTPAEFAAAVQDP